MEDIRNSGVLFALTSSLICTPEVVSVLILDLECY